MLGFRLLNFSFSELLSRIAFVSREVGGYGAVTRYRKHFRIARNNKRDNLCIAGAGRFSYRFRAPRNLETQYKVCHPNRT